MTHPYNNTEYILDLLRQEGLIDQSTRDFLKKKAVIAKRRKQDLIQWISSLGLSNPRGGEGELLQEPDILAAVAAEKGWPFIRLDPVNMNMEVVTKTLPASFCRKRLVLPLEWKGEVLEIACYDPLDTELKNDLARACKGTPRILVAPRGDIERIISEFFDFRRSIAAAETALHQSASGVDIANLEQYVNLASPETIASDKYIHKAVDHLFQYAMDQRASDIHIEPKRHETKIRLRIDGILHTVYTVPRVVHEALCTRIKALSRLDVAEKRRPQDGRMKVAWKGEDAEVRVSTVPVAFGEKMVLRLQSAEILFSPLDKLGFSQRDLEVYLEFLNHPHGMILMTGPTGSGKSTTLYSTLRHLSSPAVNITTIEDPVEMVDESFNQIAVQPQIDVTFASILRNILRQDPDIIMIGEIRDLETARYAVQAALTGHLVFSTLHTNDAVGAVTRLRDLGLEPYLVSSTLIGVVAQRLVRTICPSCKEGVEIEGERLRRLGYPSTAKVEKAMVGKGCSRCRNTGYWGRIGVYEVFRVSEAAKEMIHQAESEEAIRALAMKDGMRPLAHDACEKLLAGITTWEEVVRVSAS